MKKWKASTIYCLFVTIIVFCVLYLTIDKTVTNSAKKVCDTYVEDMCGVMLNSFNVTMRMRMDEVRGLSTVLQGNESTQPARLSYIARQYGFTHLALYEDSECRMLYGEEISAVDAEQFDLAGAHILIAEDNELNYEIISALLEDFDLVVDRAEDGAVCVQKFSDSDVGYYSRIIMDIRMPNMNGYEATRAIRDLDRADAKTVPIIAMSADAYAAAVEECMRSGMNAFTSKPVGIDEVIELLRKGGY